MPTTFYQEGERIRPEHIELTRVLIPQQMDLALFRDNCAHKDPRMREVFAHGRFPPEDPTRQLILPSWLDFHEAAWQPYPYGPKCKAVGIDVAASTDGDETSLIPGSETGVTDIHRWRERDTMQTVGWILRTMLSVYQIDLTRGHVPAVVDMDGLGKGVGDRLREQGAWVIEFRGNAGSQVDPKTYGNLRAEAYGELARRLDPAGEWGNMPWAIKPDEKLRPELTAPEKVYSGSDGLRFHISPKRRRPDTSESVQTVQDIIGRSPDTADGVVYLFHGVRELGLWSSWDIDARRREVAMPVTDDQYTAMRTQVAKAVEQPASKEGQAMSDETRELLKFLRDQARGW